jgi:arabinose-5-phosphate isomerase
MNPLESASRRARHMAAAVAWLGEELERNVAHRDAFASLVNTCCQAALGTTPALLGPRQIVFVAVGKSGGVAQVAVAMLLSVGVCARFLHPTEAFHGDFGSVTEGDAIVCISNRGRSEEILATLPRLKERGCQIFALTARLDSPLARAAEHVLLLPSVEEMCPLNQAPITSTVATLALCQLVVAATMEERQFAMERYARNHPGGAIGKRIFVKVDDLMAQGNKLPTIAPAADFKECVSRMTDFACAALLVVQGGQLLGLISEKDLRVSMEKHGPSVFQCHARDIMNPLPLTIPAGTLAADALALMENRPRPLNILPVVGLQGEAVGLLRIHDLVSQGISLT